MIRRLLTEGLLVGFEDRVIDLFEHDITEGFFLLYLLLLLAHPLPCFLITCEQAHAIERVPHGDHVVQELLGRSDAVPHGNTALDTVGEFDLDGGGRVLVFCLVLLGDEGDRRQEAAVAALYLFSLEAVGYRLE